MSDYESLHPYDQFIVARYCTVYQSVRSTFTLTPNSDKQCSLLIVFRETRNCEYGEMEVNLNTSQNNITDNWRPLILSNQNCFFIICCNITALNNTTNSDTLLQIFFLCFMALPDTQFSLGCTVDRVRPLLRCFMVLSYACCAEGKDFMDDFLFRSYLTHNFYSNHKTL
jgi:hypothetical protein